MSAHDPTVPAGPGLRPSHDVVFRHLEDEAVLVHLGTNRIYSLNTTGARFWELLAAGRDRSEITEQLLREFDVSPEQLEEEIEALLASLVSEGLVTVKQPG
jgi:Coenzyme PQQ synthesis protein D (PqqD)